MTADVTLIITKTKTKNEMVKLLGYVFGAYGNIISYEILKVADISFSL